MEISPRNSERSLKCRNCSQAALMICMCDTLKNRFCKECLPEHLMKATKIAHTLLPLQAFPFIQTKGEEKKFFERMRVLDELVSRVTHRLERLITTKEEGLLQMQLAAEELKRLVDEEIGKRCEEIKRESEKREVELKQLRNSLEKIRYAREYDINDISAQLIKDTQLAEQLLLDPLDFSLNTEPIMQQIPLIANFHFREIERVNKSLPYYDYLDSKLKIFRPKDEFPESILISRGILRSASICLIPDGSIFISGGRLKETSSKESGMLDASYNYIPLEEMKSSRDSAAMVYYQKEVFIFGGWDHARQSSIESCEKFNLERRQWDEIASMRYPRSNLTGLVSGDAIYLAGYGSNTIVRYDPFEDIYIELSISLPYSAPTRMLPSEDGLIILQSDQLVYIKLDTEVITKQVTVPYRNWWGNCDPIIEEGRIYFLEHNQVWSLNLTSSAINQLP